MTEKDEKRKVWEAKTKARLDELDAEFAKLKVQAHQAKGDAKKRLDPVMASVKEKRDRAHQKWEEAQSAGESSWEQMRDASEHLWDDVTSAMAGARDAMENR